MPTLKQRKVAKALLDNALIANPPTKGEILENAGYAPGVIKTPERVLESQGVKAALAEYGLTEELITTALVSDIQEKKKNRLGELRLGAEILGMNEGEKQGNKVLIINVTPQTGTRYGYTSPSPSGDSIGQA